MHRLIALTLMLCTSLTAGASPKPKTHKTTRANESWIGTCVHERTGPTGGTTARETLKICTSVERQKHTAERLAGKAVKVRERCEAALYAACVLRMNAEHGHDQDNTDCEPIRADGRGGTTDYGVCRTGGR